MYKWRKQKRKKKKRNDNIVGGENPGQPTKHDGFGLD